MKLSLLLFSMLSFGTLAEINAFAHPYGPYKVGKPYTISSGKTFTPKEVTALKERGIASWYGKDFDGNMTANGGTFNSTLNTAAHRTLPMPSAVLITNLVNGKSLVVVVNDRGPFSDTEGRLIDVSRQVAKDLDFIGQGRASVEVEYIPSLSEKLKNGQDITKEDIAQILSGKKIQPAEITQNINIQDEFSMGRAIGKTSFLEAKDDSVLYVQAGVFEVLGNAQELYKNLAGNISSIQIRSEKRNDKNYYVVRSGPFQSQPAAEESRNEIGKLCKDCNPILVMI